MNLEKMKQIVDLKEELSKLSSEYFIKKQEATKEKIESLVTQAESEFESYFIAAGFEISHPAKNQIHAKYKSDTIKFSSANQSFWFEYYNDSLASVQITETSNTSSRNSNYTSPRGISQDKDIELLQANILKEKENIAGIEDLEYCYKLNTHTKEHTSFKDVLMYVFK